MNEVAILPIVLITATIVGIIILLGWFACLIIEYKFKAKETDEKDS